MDDKIIQDLIKLKSNPKLEQADHISILNNLYWEYKNGVEELKPIALFFINGFDDLPALKEKHLWNKDKYQDEMHSFFEAHPELILMIDNLLREYGK